MQVILTIMTLSIPVYIFYKLVDSVYKGENKIFKKIKGILGGKFLECMYMTFFLAVCTLGFILIFNGVKAGQPLSKYENGGYLNVYTSLSFDHILTILVFFILGIIAYLILRIYAHKLSPMFYSICCSLLILNIVFTVVYYFHTKTYCHFDLKI